MKRKTPPSSSSNGDDIERSNLSSSQSSTSNTSVETSEQPAPPQKRKYVRRKNVAKTAEDIVPLNYQPNNFDPNFNKMLNLKAIALNDQKTAVVDSHTREELIKKGDCIYMLCEPPTEPFYLAKVIGFSVKNLDLMVSVVWFYRARDLNRRCSDSRLVYASLQRDTCPVSSYRGHINVQHKASVKDVRLFRKAPDTFYFDKFYDRYMYKMYEMIPTDSLQNLTPNYQLALNKRFEFIFVENGKANDLFAEPKHCDKCLEWCSSSESVDCGDCGKSFHLLCCEPPLYEKPKRGFAWYCLECFEKAQAIKMESNGDLEIDERKIIVKKESPKPEHTTLKYEQIAQKFLENDLSNSLEQRRLLEEWPWRYLGMYSKLEDAMDLQDRPYARACSRLGGKFQCTSISEEWPNHIIQYYDSKLPPKFVRRGRLSHKKPGRKKKKPDFNEGGIDRDFGNINYDQPMPVPEEFKDLPEKEYPPWLKPKPIGYTERGGENTSVLLWKSNTDIIPQELIENYLEKCRPLASLIGVDYRTPNFMDVCLRSLLNYDYDTHKAFDDVSGKISRDFIQQPTFSSEEVKLFEEGVSLYGSELHLVYQHVKTQPSSMIVRFYYNWKKTARGHEIWDNFTGRLKNRRKHKFIDGIDDPIDEGFYLNDQIEKLNVKFKCMHCQTTHSLKWMCGPGARLSPDNLMDGLCLRCGIIWRKYATKWEDPQLVLKREDKKYDYLIKKGTEYELIRNAQLTMANRAAVENSQAGDYKTCFKTTEGDVTYLQEPSNNQAA